MAECSNAVYGGEQKNMKKPKETKKEIRLAEIRVAEITVPIVGKTPLLMDRFPPKTRDAILAKQTGVSKTATKTPRKIEEETREAVHMTRSKKVGFPAEGFKRGMMECTSYVGDKFFSKKLIMGIQIVNTEDGLVPIKWKKQDVLEHNIGHTTKFSPRFHDWTCELKIRYDANNLSPQDILTLLNYAGFYVGVGAWRPKGKDGGSGNFGMYAVGKTKATT